MKYLFILFNIIFILSGALRLTAQPLSVTIEQPDAVAGSYPTPNSEFSISEGILHFGDLQFPGSPVWSISNQMNRFTILEKGEELSIAQFDDSGNRLYSKVLPYFNQDDTTLKLYTFLDGRAVIRDNVANFSFLDTAGDLMYSISNSSQSPSGERPSELAAGSRGITTVLYNPAISYGQATGSRAVLVFGEENTKEFFRSENKEISYLKVSDDGKFLLLIADNGSASEVFYYDRFGNILFTILPDQKITGANITGNGAYLTIYTAGMVQVFDVSSGERVGSASLNQSIIYAAYDENKNVMISFGGSLGENRVSNPSVMVVDIEQRSIATENINGTLHTLNPDNIALRSNTPGHFSLDGFREGVKIRY